MRDLNLPWHVSPTGGTAVVDANQEIVAIARHWEQAASIVQHINNTYRPKRPELETVGGKDLIIAGLKELIRRIAEDEASVEDYIFMGEITMWWKLHREGKVIP